MTVEKILAGDILAVARLITKIERRDPEAFDVVKKIYSKCGNAHIIGITGPPGVGKSCLVASLVSEYRKRGKTIGVLAVDPTSPLSGGAFLGDRARMIEACRGGGVFIRSMASRGALGGGAEAVNTATDVLDAAGKDVILIETVGVGQSEIEITKLAHTVILALMPGYGDSLQVLKAGIMEVSDIFVINKSDKPGADNTVAEIARYHTWDENHRSDTQWHVPVLKTCALKNEGVSNLTDELIKHYKFLNNNNSFSSKNKERRLKQFLNVLRRKIKEEFLETLKTDQYLKEWVEEISDLKLDPYSASEQVIKLIKKTRAQLNRNMEQPRKNS